jgi:hypothetical protein
VKEHSKGEIYVPPRGAKGAIDGVSSSMSGRRDPQESIPDIDIPVGQPRHCLA